MMDRPPDVNYSYDDSGVTYLKGRLTQVTAGTVSTTRYSSYDALGRVTGSRQTTGFSGLFVLPANQAHAESTKSELLKIGLRRAVIQAN
mgnify:CR=1 FL=1